MTSNQIVSGIVGRQRKVPALGTALLMVLSRKHSD